MRRRDFLSGASLIALLAASPASAWIHGLAFHNSLLIGLNGPNYFSGFSPFLNWWKQADAMSMHRTVGGTISGQAIWDAGGYLNTTTGELINPVPSDVVSIARLFYAAVNSFQAAQGSTYANETWVAKWDGTATGNIDFLTSGNTQDKSTPGQISFTQGSTDGSLQLTLTVTNVNDPPRNIRIYQTRYATNVANGETFNPDWLAQVRKFRTIRLMDWQGTNNSTVVNFSQLADMGFNSWALPFQAAGTNGPFGPKGSAHPDLICTLANASGCNVHVCIPLTASDAFVTAFATFMQANTSVEVTYELSNECWNSGFNQFGYCQTQGSTNWPGDTARAFKWYGYQSARFMKIIRDVYNDRTRWRGALATQTVNTAVTNNNLIGVNFYLTSLGGALVVSDLYKSLYVTGYFGDGTPASNISAITAANPGRVTSAGHGFTNGNVVRLFVAQPTALNNTDVTVTVVDADNYTIGVDTSAMTPFSNGGVNAYACPSKIFDLMDQSNTNFVSTPATYPTKYTYFNQQIRDSYLTGTCTFGFSTSIHVAALKATYWPAQLTIAQANGLTLRQYEGGSNMAGNILVAGFGGQPQFTEFTVASAHSTELATAYSTMYSGFLTIGGECPAKFTEAGQLSAFGAWGGISFWPSVGNGNTSDAANPVWQATLAAT